MNPNKLPSLKKIKYFRNRVQNNFDFSLDFLLLEFGGEIKDTKYSNRYSLDIPVNLWLMENFF